MKNYCNIQQAGIQAYNWFAGIFNAHMFGNFEKDWS